MSETTIDRRTDTPTTGLEAVREDREKIEAKIAEADGPLADVAEALIEAADAKDSTER